MIEATPLPGGHVIPLQTVLEQRADDERITTAVRKLRSSCPDFASDELITLEGRFRATLYMQGYTPEQWYRQSLAIAEELLGPSLRGMEKQVNQALFFSSRYRFAEAPQPEILRHYSFGEPIPDPDLQAMGGHKKLLYAIPPASGAQSVLERFLAAADHEKLFLMFPSGIREEIIELAKRHRYETVVIVEPVDAAYPHADYVVSRDSGWGAYATVVATNAHAAVVFGDPEGHEEVLLAMENKGKPIFVASAWDGSSTLDKLEDYISFTGDDLAARLVEVPSDSEIYKRSPLWSKFKDHMRLVCDGLGWSLRDASIPPLGYFSRLRTLLEQEASTATVERLSQRPDIVAIANALEEVRRDGFEAYFEDPG